MLDINNFDSLIKFVSEKTGKSHEELLEMVAQKKQKYEGLLNENAALFMIGKELGLDLNLESNTRIDNIKIKDLKSGQANLSLQLKVKEIMQPKTYEKNGKKGNLCNLILSDETGEIRLTLWNQNIQKLELKGIEKNSIVKIKNAFVSSYQDIKQLNLGYGSEFVLVEKGNNHSLITDYNNLQNGMNSIDLIGKVKRIFEEKSFDSKGKQGKLRGFELVNGNQKVRCTAWNELVNSISDLKENDVIRIENAYTKQGLNSVEVNLGWKSRIIKNPVMPENLDLEQKPVKLLDLEENQWNLIINASVGDPFSKKLYYYACPNCRKKVEEMSSNEFQCIKCGVVEPQFRLISSCQLRDETGYEVKTSFFDEQVEKLFNFKKEDLMTAVSQGGEEQFTEKIKENAVNKEIKLTANTKKNNFSGAIELNCVNIIEIK